MASRKRSSDEGSSAAKRAKILFDRQRARFPPGSTASPISATPNSSGDDDDDVEEIAPPSNLPQPPLQHRSSLVIEDEVFRSLTSGNQNVFLTGPAGTGKTQFIKAIIPKLRATGKIVRVIAPTGATALNVDGQTLHSFFGWTPNTTKRSLEAIGDHAREQVVQEAMSHTDIIIIDEISMISAEMLDRMDYHLRISRGQNKPFGGIRLLVCGDFSQLPPIKPFETCVRCSQPRVAVEWGVVWSCNRCEDEVFANQQWAFCSGSWRSAKFNNVLLTQVHRQSNPEFQTIIWELFLGNDLSPQDKHILSSTPLQITRNTMHLFSTRKEIQLHDMGRFEALPGSPQVYVAYDDCYVNPNHRKAGLWPLDLKLHATGHLARQANHPFESKIILKQDMPVVLIHNYAKGKGLCNGLLGKIVGWEYRSVEDIRQGNKGFDESGWAWEVKEGRVVSGFLPTLRPCHEASQLKQLDNFVTFRRPEAMWPVVEFQNGVTEPIYPVTSYDEFIYNDQITYYMRTQVPLLSAWSFTIHRSQGLTISDYVADLSQSFCPALSYVAISRAPAFEHLQVRGADRIGPGYQTVRNFYAATFPELKPRMKGNGIIISSRRKSDKRQARRIIERAISRGTQEDEPTTPLL